MFMPMDVSPPVLLPVLKPEYHGRGVRRNMLNELGIDWLFGTSGHENLHRFVVIADCPIIQAAFHTSVRLGLGDL